MLIFVRSQHAKAFQYLIVVVLAALAVFEIIQFTWNASLPRGDKSPNYMIRNNKNIWTAWEEERAIHRMTGKSCRYTPPRIKTNWVWIWKQLEKYSFLLRWDYWDCRECDDSGGSAACRKLQRRHWCRAFPSHPWDAPPRMTSWQSSTDASSLPFTMLRHHSHRPPRKVPMYHAPACSLQQPLCFNLTQCRGNRTDPLAVYGHGEALSSVLKSEYEKSMPHVIRTVTDPSEACLRIVGARNLAAFSTPDEMWNDPNWNSGQNHFIWMAHVIYEGHGDHPFHQNAHFGYAALFSPNLDKGYHRVGYDMVHGMRKWSRPPDTASLDLHRQRRYIVSFKGSITGWDKMYWQHRWLAAEYWEEADDVLVDVTCRGKPHYQSNEFGSILLNSTFVFCPGGGSVMSFRFGEALIADAIPVVTATFIPPLHPEIDWSACLVRVSDSQIVDLPRMLRSLPKAEVQARQSACHQLQTTLFGNSLNHDHMVMALRIWNLRVRVALAMEDGAKELSRLEEADQNPS